MNDNGRTLVEMMHREAVEQLRHQPLPSLPEATIHYTELPEATAGEPLCLEWNFYRREVGRLLAESQEGRWVLIKADQILGIWDNQEGALTAGYQRFLRQPFLVHQVQERERLLRTGYNRLCS